MLSAILSKVTGRSALDYAREKLFGPLGITDVFWRGDPQGASGGGAGLYLQPRDMAKLGELWLHDGLWDGQKLLPDGWIEQVRNAKVEMPIPGFRYANLFWTIPAKEVFMAVGYDRQLIVVLPELDIVAAFTGARRYSNAIGKPSLPTYSMTVAIDRLKAAAKSAEALPEDPAALAALADKVAEMAKEARTEASAPSPLEAAISGKIYRLRPNPLRFRNMSLTFDKGGASYFSAQN